MTEMTVECPICYEHVDPTKNCMTTECGHTFHANCIMTNIRHNGFGCPFCRTEMAAVAHDDEDDEDETIEDNEEDDEDDDDDEDEGEVEPYEQRTLIDEDYSLRGFRLFMNRIDEEHPEADDTGYDYLLSYNPQEYGGLGLREIPTIDAMTTILQSRGITMYQLVASIMNDHEEYMECEAATAQADMLWQTMRGIITGFTGIQAAQRSLHQVIHKSPAEQVREILDEMVDSLVA